MTQSTLQAEDSLRRFFERGGHVFPELRMIPGDKIPEPYKSLLVHQTDMTSTLEKFHEDRIHLRVLRTETEGNLYFREVILLLDGSNKPVEFGIIQIYLDRFPQRAVTSILEARLPLGRLLHDYSVPYVSSPRGFFEVTPEQETSDLLGVEPGQPLFGRRNSLLNPEGKLLADIVEILPV